MDGLLAEVAAKRKTIDSDSSRPRKYMRRGDIERLQEEEARKAKEEKQRGEQEAQDLAAEKQRAEFNARVCLLFLLCYRGFILRLFILQGTPCTCFNLFPAS